MYCSLVSIKSKHKSSNPLSEHRIFQTKLYRALLSQGGDVYNEMVVREPGRRTKEIRCKWQFNKRQWNIIIFDMETNLYITLFSFL